MSFQQHTGNRCPVHPDTPILYQLEDGIPRFDRAGNLAWNIERPEEGRVIWFAPVEK